jgi:hypothetical protein
VKRSPLTRKTPLKAKAAPRVRTPLARASVPLRRVPLAQKRHEARSGAGSQAQNARGPCGSGGICEIWLYGIVPGPTPQRRRATASSEGAGGRHGEAAEANDRLSNVLHSCRACHEWCHRNPTTARLHGWMARNGTDLREEPVWYRGHEWVDLGDDGSVTPCASS